MREMEAKACEHARERDGASAVLVPRSVTELFITIKTNNDRVIPLASYEM